MAVMEPIGRKLTKSELDEFKLRLAATSDPHQKAMILKELSKRIAESRQSAA